MKTFRVAELTILGLGASLTMEKGEHKTQLKARLSVIFWEKEWILLGR